MNQCFITLILFYQVFISPIPLKAYRHTFHGLIALRHQREALMT